MSVIDEYRRRLSDIAAQATTILGNIADTEKRLGDLKNEVKKIYEEIDEVLDMEIKK